MCQVSRDKSSCQTNLLNGRSDDNKNVCHILSDGKTSDTKKQICYNSDKKGATMTAVKQEAQKMIQNLPDNCTYEDIQYHLYVAKKIKNGIDRAKNGEVSSHQDAKKRMAKWLSN